MTANYNGTVEQSENLSLTPYQMTVVGGIAGSGTDNVAFQVNRRAQCRFTIAMHHMSCTLHANIIMGTLRKSSYSII